MGMIKTYRKTALIDSIHWDGTVPSTRHIVDWAADFGVEIELCSEYDHDTREATLKLRIPTLEGPMYASVGDYIAKGIQNEFWAIKPEVMNATYEEA